MSVSDSMPVRVAATIAAAVVLTAGPMAGVGRAAPVNDDFADATSFALTDPSPLSGTNVGATREPGEPNHNAWNSHSSVWWTFTPSSPGEVTFSLVGTPFDAVIAVYTGSTLENLELVYYPSGSGDDPPLTVEAATTYHVAVASTEYADQGPITLGFTWVETAPVGTISVEEPLGTPVDASDFGTASVGSTTRHTLYVRNVGEGPLHIDSVTLSTRSFASGEYKIVQDEASEESIPPGGYRRVVVAFEPTSGPTGTPDAYDYVGSLPGQGMSSY